MGVNYYYKTDRRFLLDHCEPDEDGLIHIGKSSHGWCFALHVYPPLIRTLNCWIEVWEIGKCLITDEYGCNMTPKEMHTVITDRSHPERPGYFTRDLLEENFAEVGPNGLLRRKIDGIYCVGHGLGTWDAMVGQFS